MSSRRSSRKSPGRKSPRGKSPVLSAQQEALVRKEVRASIARSLTPKRRRSSSGGRGSSGGYHHHHRHSQHYGLLSALGFAPRADATMEYLTSILSGLSIAPNLYGDACTRILAQLGITGFSNPMSAMLKAIQDAAAGTAAGGTTVTTTSGGARSGTAGDVTFKSLDTAIDPLSALGLGSGLDLSGLGNLSGIPGINALLGNAGLGLDGLGLGGLGDSIEIQTDSQGRFFFCPVRSRNIYIPTLFGGMTIRIKRNSKGRYFTCPRERKHYYLF